MDDTDPMDRVDPIVIDGSQGEGGGQVLRTSLSLSAITGKPVRLHHIRAGRKKPGLRRQHLIAVRTAAQICRASVKGDEVGSTEIEFWPGQIQGGDYRVQIGTAGSTTLVLQTALWPLIMANRPSTLMITGGTHNPMAPTFEFLERSFVPAIARFGAHVELELGGYGFYPAGGGVLRASIEPSSLEPANLETRGELYEQGAGALAVVANLPESIARRELQELARSLGWSQAQLEARAVPSPGPGNALIAWVRHEQGQNVFTAIGEKGKPAKTVARQVAREVAEFCEAPDVPVDEHLADQLLVPIALAGGGSFRTVEPSLHTTTNATIIGRFVPIEFSIERAEGAWTITAKAAEPGA